MEPLEALDPTNSEKPDPLEPNSELQKKALGIESSSYGIERHIAQSECHIIESACSVSLEADKENQGLWHSELPTLTENDPEAEIEDVQDQQGP